MSVFDRFWSEWGIAILTDPVRHTPKDLRTATGALLPLTDFNDTEGGREVLNALQKWRFPKQPEGRDTITEYTRPIHNKFSHMSTAFGYFAVNFDLFRFIGRGGTGVKYVGARSK